MGAEQQLQNFIRSIDTQGSTTGFLPDKGEYDAALKAQLDELFARLPAGEEAFNADLASRGIFRSGEAPKNLYSSVYAPIARAGASAIAQSNLGYAQRFQQGRIAEEQVGLSKLQLKGQGYANLLQYDASKAGFWGEIIGTGAGLAALALIK